MTEREGTFLTDFDFLTVVVSRDCGHYPRFASETRGILRLFPDDASGFGSPTNSACGGRLLSAKLLQSQPF